MTSWASPPAISWRNVSARLPRRVDAWWPWCVMITLPLLRWTNAKPEGRATAATVGPRAARANLKVVRRAATLALLAAALCAAPAQAPLAPPATGTAAVALPHVTTNQIVARPAMPGPSRAVAISRDGERAFAAAGNAVAAFDFGMVPAAPLPGIPPFTIAARDLGAPAVGVAVSPGAATAYAAAGTSLFVLDARSLAVRHRVVLHGTAVALALAPQGTLAAVVLAKGRVAMVATGAAKLLRRVKVKRAAGVAFDASGTAWVSAPRRLFAVRPGSREPEKHPLSLGAG